MNLLGLHLLVYELTAYLFSGAFLMFGESSLFQLLQSEWTSNSLYLFFLVTTVLTGFILCKRDSPECSEWQVDERLIIFGLISLAAAFRFYGVDWGLPNAFHPDEFEEARFLRGMMRSGSIDPHYSQQPPLILYLSWPISNLLNVLGVYDNNSVVRNVLAGRLLNASAGVVSVILLYGIGRKLTSRFAAGLGALLLAVSPLHVTNGRYMKQDSLLVMFILACALSVLTATREKKIRFFYYGAFFAGLAAGTKYSGIACIGILLSAPWLDAEKFSLRPNLKLAKHALIACGAMVATFFLSMPYVLLNRENFEHLLNGMAFESKHARTGHHGLAIDPWNQLWMFHFARSLVPGLHFLPILFSLLGIGMLLKQRKTAGLWLIMLLLMFYLPAEWARSKPPPQPDRYVLACIPFLALIASMYLDSFRNRLSQRELILGAALLLMFPTIRSAQLASELRYDTRDEMSDWLDANLAPGARILKAGGSAYLPRIPRKFTSIAAKKVIGRDKSNLIQTLQNSKYDYLITTSISTGRFSVQNLPAGNDRPLRVRQAMRTIEQNLPVVKRIAPRFGSYGFHNPTIVLYAIPH